MTRRRAPARDRPRRARAIGCPSNVVITADGVPGMRSSVADTMPPDTAPTYIPIIITRASVASIPNVSGIVSEISMPPPNPGIAPTTMPADTPRSSHNPVGRLAI